MRFGVSYGNHGDGVHVEDVVVYIRNALLAAGENAYLLPGLLTSGVNILLECFTSEQAWQISQLKRRSRARFIVVVSEFTDGRRFNSHITSGEGHYVNAEYWQKRFETFLEVAEAADAIWSLSEYSLPEYRALFPDKPVLFFPIGFDEFFPEPRILTRKEKDIDLLFTGSITPHRKALLGELQERFQVMTAPVTTLAASRADLVLRSKAALHLNLLPDAMYSSVMRHHYLIMSGATVVSEKARTIGPLDDFITQFETPSFAAGIDDLIHNGGWEQRGTALREQYRQSRPLGEPIRRLIKDSLQH